jgi:hypothetical protein
MGMSFEEMKQRKLKRMLGLRIMNALGMVAWRKCEYEIAQQKLRLIHPLTWIWAFALFVYGIFIQGVPDTLEEFKGIWKYELVWF